MTDTTASDQPAVSAAGVVGDSFRLLIRNYWPMAILCVAWVVADLLLGLLFFIPLLGQLLMIFLFSLLFGTGFLISLAITRREPSFMTYLSKALAPARFAELAIVLAPLAIAAIAFSMLGRVVRFGGLIASGAAENWAPMFILMIVVGIPVFLLNIWLTLKFSFAPAFVAAAPPAAPIAPLQRMKQSIALSRGRSWSFMWGIILAMLASVVFGFIPIVGPIVVEALFVQPYLFCVMVVIYHRLIGRELEGLKPRAPKPAAEAEAEQSGPI